MAYTSRSGAVLVHGSAHSVYLRGGEVFFGFDSSGMPLIDDQTTQADIVPVMEAKLGRMNPVVTDWDRAARRWLDAIESVSPRVLRFNGQWWDMPAKEHPSAGDVLTGAHATTPPSPNTF